MNILQALDQFDRIHKSCFQKNLDEDFLENIENFANTWIAAGLPNSSKFHILRYHVADFCKTTKTGLSKYGEQASEAVHFDFLVMCNRVKAPENSETYDRQLLRAVVLYNSEHL